MTLEVHDILFSTVVAVFWLDVHRVLTVARTSQLLA